METCLYAAVQVYVPLKLCGAHELTSIDPLESAAISRELFNTPAPIESEDCLYINVYAPAGKPAGAGRAVLFWIFGGSLQIGHAGKFKVNILSSGLISSCLRSNIIRW